MVDGETQTCTALINKNNGELVYREWTNGDWADFDKGIEDIHTHTMGDINESVTEDLIDKVASKLKPPYIYNLFSMGFTYSDSELILSKLFGTPIYIYDNSHHFGLDNSVSNATEWRVETTNNEDVLYVEFDDGYFQDWRGKDSIDSNIDLR